MCQQMKQNSIFPGMEMLTLPSSPEVPRTLNPVEPACPHEQKPDQVAEPAVS